MTSPYFNHVECTEEQDLYHDLAKELVYLGGIEVLYVKMENLNSEELDRLFLENRFEELRKKNCYVLDMWWDEPPQHIQGDELFAKFGFSTPQTCRFYCAIRYFREEVGDGRPEEGSYIFTPKWKNDTFGPEDIWKINSVTDAKISSHQLGSPVYFAIDCERAKYSHQDIEDGTMQLSDIKDTMSGELGPEDALEDSDILEEFGKDFLDFDENNPFGMP